MWVAVHGMFNTGTLLVCSRVSSSWLQFYLCFILVLNHIRQCTGLHLALQSRTILGWAGDEGVGHHTKCQVSSSSWPHVSQVGHRQGKRPCIISGPKALSLWSFPLVNNSPFSPSQNYIPFHSRFFRCFVSRPHQLCSGLTLNSMLTDHS